MSKTGQITKFKTSAPPKKSADKKIKDSDSLNDMFMADDEDSRRNLQEKLDIATEEQNTAKRATQSKKDFIQFDDDDEEEKPSNPSRTNATQNQSKSAIDNIFKKVKKSNDDYSRTEVTQNDSGRDRNHRERDQQYSDSYSQRKERESSAPNVPWMSIRTGSISSSLVRAHNEIIEFVNHVVPTKEAHRIRERSLERLTQKIMVVFPQCMVRAFGSFATKVYLPNADIDLVVINFDMPSTSILHKLAQSLQKDNEYEQFQIIRSAKVPLIKLVEKATQINFDISFNQLDGIKQIKIVEKSLEIYPEIKYLVIVLKCMLRQRDLHETYHGGVGSFLLFCLVLTFVRELKKDFISINKREEMKDLLLSDILLMLFEFYGVNFDLGGKSILISNGGGIIDKVVRDSSLSVISPQDPRHDIGGPSFRIRDIFNVFKNRYHFLTNYNFSEGESFMKYLIDPEKL